MAGKPRKPLTTGDVPDPNQDEQVPDNPARSRHPVLIGLSSLGTVSTLLVLHRSGVLSERTTTVLLVGTMIGTLLSHGLISGTLSLNLGQDKKSRS
jgi:hypothetical protein